MSVPNLFTVKQLCAKHPALAVGGVRFHIFNEDTNGLRESGAIVRIGRKVTVDEEKYFEWLLSQNGKNQQVTKDV